jgi:pentatricopeptide repeat protein
MACVAQIESLALLEVSLSRSCLSRRAYRSTPCLRGQITIPHLGARILTTQKQGYGPRASAAGDARDISTGVLTGNREAYVEPSSSVRSLLKHQRLAAAFTQFMAEAELGRLPPSISVTEALITSLCAQQRHSEARQVYAILELCGGPRLRYNTYQALLKACLTTNDIEGAISIFRDIQAGDMRPNKVTYCGLISALGKQRRKGSRYVELAYDLWVELQSSTNGGSQLDSAALRTGMKACVDIGKMDEAEQVLKIGLENKVQGANDVRNYNILLKGYAMNGNVRAQINDVMERMYAAKVKPSRVTYNILIDSYVRAGQVVEAVSRMNEATESGLELDAFSYTSLIKGCVKAGDMQGATTVLEDMRIARIKPTYITFSTLIDGHARAGDLITARKMLQTMISAGEKPSAVTYNSLLRGYAQISDTDALPQALQLLDDMQQQGVAPAVDTFNTLMSAAMSAGHGNVAIDLYERMLGAELRPDGVTFTILLQAHASLGAVSEAVAAFESLSKDPNAAMDIRAYNAMVNAFAMAGDMGAAENMLGKACEFANRIGAPPPVEAFGAVVTGYARLKLVAPAVQTVRRFNAAGGTPDVQMLDILVDLCVRTGEFKIAMQAVRSMELIGAEVDKEKYRTLVVNRMEYLAAAEAKAQKRRNNYASYYKNKSSYDSVQGGGADSRPADKNAYLERFKFWLGLPNRYYDDDSE